MSARRKPPYSAVLLPLGRSPVWFVEAPVPPQRKSLPTYDRLTAEGAQPVYAPRDEPWKMRSAMVADPDGNLIEIASDFWE